MRNYLLYPVLAVAVLMVGCRSDANPPSYVPDPNITKHCDDQGQCICLNASGGDVACPQ